MLKKNSQLINNIISLALSDLLIVFIPLLTMPLLARALGGDTYGQYLLFSTLIMFSHTVIDYSVGITGVREVSVLLEKGLDTTKAYISFQLIRSAFSLIYFLLLILLILLGFFEVENPLNFVLTIGIYLLGYVMCAPWYLLAIGKIKWFTVAVVFSRLSLLVFIVLFVGSASDISFLMYASVVPFFIASILIFSYSFKFHKVDICLDDIFLRVKKGGNTFVGIISPNLYNNIPVIILGGILTASEFAFFSLATRLSSLCITAQNVLVKASYPIMSINKTIDDVKALMFANLALATLFCISVLSFGQPLLELLLGTEFLKVYYYLNFFLPGLVFAGLANAISFGFVFPNNLDVEYRKVAVKTSCFSALVGCFLFYQLQAEGIAILISFARFLLFFNLMLIFLRRKS